MTLSVVVTGLSYQQEKELAKELKGIDYEIVDTVGEAKGQFVCMVEPTAKYSPGYFFRNMYVFLSQPKFKKLAMVAPAVEDTRNKIYGYKYTNGVTPVKRPVSSSVHSVQGAPIDGAIIRASSIRGDLNSFCIDLWERGMRVQLNPDTTYHLPVLFHPDDTVEPSKVVIDCWKREAI